MYPGSLFGFSAARGIVYWVEIVRYLLYEYLKIICVRVNDPRDDKSEDLLPA